jgi:PKD repeat protein
MPRSAVAQGNPALVRCATTSVMEQMRDQGLWPETDAQFEAWMAQKLSASRSGQGGALSPATQYTIPVVVHIIYQNETDVWNISDQQVLSQIQILNEDFRRLNADTVNTPAGFAAVAGYPNIEFCLARRDTLGQNTTGIIRHRFQQRASWSTGQFDGTVKPATRWNPNQYYNIWIANLSGGVLGYAQFPTGSGLQGLSGGSNANTDGIVLLYSSVGRPPQNPFPGQYNLGRTATHEIGHALGLRHIWGDGNNCSATDYCADTPPSDAANYGCPLTHASCGGLDMVQNYMDYTNDACMNLFTSNQVARMWTVLQNSPRRNSLLSSLACMPPDVVPSAAWFQRADTLCPGGTVEFRDQSLNRPTRWRWSFPGGIPASDTNQFPGPIRYDSVGVYSVTLVVSNSAGADTLVMAGAVRVMNGLVASMDSLLPLCQEAPPYFLTAGHPRGGDYSGAGLDSLGRFVPALAGPGLHPIVYTLRGNCLSRDTAWIRVHPTPTVSIAALSALCRNNGPVALTGSPSSGSFSGPGVSGSFFDPRVAGVGLHTLRYVYTDSLGCTGRDSVQVRVRALPGLGFPAPSPVCLDRDTLRLVGGSPSGGTYVGNGLVNGVVQLRNLGAGTHQVGYTVVDTNGCRDTLWRSLIIRQPQALAFSALGPYCPTEVNVILANASIGGGSFSGPGVSFGIFSPSQAGPGWHSIVYTVNDLGCVLTDSFRIRVTAQAPSEIRQYHPDSLFSWYRGTSYQWYVDGTWLPALNARSIRPPRSGFYTVQLGTDSCLTLVSPPYQYFVTGVPSIDERGSKSHGLEVPNPFGDQLSLTWLGGSWSDVLEIRVLDATGRVVFGPCSPNRCGATGDNKTWNLNASSWPVGLYHVVWQTHQRVLTQKVLRILRP